MYASLALSLRDSLEESERAAPDPGADNPLRRYRAAPLAFVRDCFLWRPGEGPSAYQAEVLEELPARRRVCLRGPHGLGKTSLAAWIVLWFALTSDGEDWKAVCTASAWRQLTHYLWPEVRKWARRLRWERLGRAPFDDRTELLSLSLKLRTGEAFTVASSEPALIEGAHATRLLYLFDESKAIPDATFDAAEGAFATAGIDTADEAYAVAISTPGEPLGRFYDIQRRAPGYEDWWVRAVTLEEAVAAGRVSREWAGQRAAQWGTQSAIFKNRVLGEFATSESDGVIPLSWVEAAQRRWEAWVAAGRPGQVTRLGVDVARSGGDMTVIALRVGTGRGAVVSELRRTAHADTMATTGRIMGVLNTTTPGVTAVVDVIGLGAGVVDRLREQGAAVEAFNASMAARVGDHELRDRSGELGFTSMRSAAWWGLRERLDPDTGDDLALPPDERLTGDLVAPKWRVLSGGRIQVESKDDIRKRLGRSTDDGDAVVMALAPPAAPPVSLAMGGARGWGFGGREARLLQSRSGVREREQERRRPGHR